MIERDIVRIDQNLCDGCGDCVAACAEGAIAIVDGTARLVKEDYCDGLGVCLGYCPQGAITIERRQAPAFDEAAVSRAAVGAGDCGEISARPALSVINEQAAESGCPGSRQRMLPPPPPSAGKPPGRGRSPLRHWPVQLHLLHPGAEFLRAADVVLAADCVAFAMPDFHEQLLDGNALAIACPKLDSNQERYLDKLVAMIDDARIRSLVVVVMEVPCCAGLVRLAQEAIRRSQRSLPLSTVVIGTGGELLRDASGVG